MTVLYNEILRLSGERYKKNPNSNTNGGHNFYLRSDEVSILIEGVEGDSPAKRVKSVLGYGASSGLAGEGVIFTTANLGDSETVEARLKDKQLVAE